MEKEQVKQIYFTIKQEAELHGYENIENRMESTLKTFFCKGFDFYTFGLDVVLPMLTDNATTLKLIESVKDNRMTFRTMVAEHKTKTQEINFSQKLTTRAKREMSIEVRDSFVKQFSKLESKFNSQKKELDSTAKAILDSFINDFEEYYEQAPELIKRIRMYFTNNTEEYNTNKIADDIYIAQDEPKRYTDVNEYIGNMFANVARIHKQDPRQFIYQLQQDAEKSDLLEEEYLIKAYLDCKEEFEQYLIDQIAKEEELRAIPTPEPKSSIVSKAINKLMGGTN